MGVSFRSSPIVADTRGTRPILHEEIEVTVTVSVGYISIYKLH